MIKNNMKKFNPRYVTLSRIFLSCTLTCQRKHIPILEREKEKSMKKIWGEKYQWIKKERKIKKCVSHRKRNDYK